MVEYLLNLKKNPNTLTAAAINEQEVGSGKNVNIIEKLFNDLDLGSLK